MPELSDEWRFGGLLIGEVVKPGQRREVFNIRLFVLGGTDPLIVRSAQLENLHKRN